MITIVTNGLTINIPASITDSLSINGIAVSVGDGTQSIAVSLPIQTGIPVFITSVVILLVLVLVGALGAWAIVKRRDTANLSWWALATGMWATVFGIAAAAWRLSQVETVGDSQFFAGRFMLEIGLASPRLVMCMVVAVTGVTLSMVLRLFRRTGALR